MNSDTIFDLQQSKKETELIVQNSDIELDVATNIMEQVSEFPYIVSLVKLRKAALNYIDYRFFANWEGSLNRQIKSQKIKFLIF